MIDHDISYTIWLHLRSSGCLSFSSGGSRDSSGRSVGLVGDTCSTIPREGCRGTWTARALALGHTSESQAASGADGAGGRSAPSGEKAPNYVIKPVILHN